MTYNGKTLNINDFKSRRDFLSQDFFVPKDLIHETQFILNDPENSKSKEDWQCLSQKLLKTTIKTSLDGNGQFITNACKTVFEWHMSTESMSSVKLRRFMHMKSLSVWQRKLADVLFKSLNPSKIMFFKQFDIEHVYVLVDNPSTEIIFKYSQQYCDFLLSEPDIFFEFLVVGLDEYYEKDMPNIIVINSGDYHAND